MMKSEIDDQSGRSFRDKAPKFEIFRFEQIWAIITTNKPPLPVTPPESLI